jgi:hypothetical protein
VPFANTLGDLNADQSRVTNVTFDGKTLPFSLRVQTFKKVEIYHTFDGAVTINLAGFKSPIPIGDCNGHRCVSAEAQPMQ